MIKSQSLPTSTQLTAYNVPRRFKPHSKLHVFLALKAPNEVKASQTEYTLFIVLSALRGVISREKLYDPNNSTVIICSAELEDAIGMKHLHITEVRDVVLMQMEPPSSSLLASLQPLPPQPQQQAPLDNAGGQQQKFDAEARFWVKPLFLRVLRQVKGVNPTQVVFTYREITSYLSQYILDNKDKFFDERNIRVANVADDALGKAFNVRAFHRTQVTALLRSQLIPFKPSMPCKSPPNDQENHSRSRKRSADPDDSSSPPPRRARRRSNRGSISITVFASSSPSSSQRDSDEETILSAQGYSTCPVDNDDDDDDDEQEVAESNDFDVYDIEYEPEGASSEDEDKHKNKRTADSSDDDESDLDIQAIVFATAVDIVENFSYDDDADESSDNDDDDDPTKADLENADTWTCLDCNQPNTPYIRYCSACYKERKGWLPERPKPKKKNPNCDSSKNGTKKLERSISEETGKSTEESSSQDSGFAESQELSDDEKLMNEVKLNQKIFSSSSMTSVGGICSLCCAQPKNACLIHGRISHQVCCYGCAKKLFKNRRGCPVCRRRIEKITKNIVA